MGSGTCSLDCAIATGVDGGRGDAGADDGGEDAGTPTSCTLACGNGASGSSTCAVGTTCHCGG